MEKKFHLLPLFKYRREIPISTDELGARRIITLEQNTLSIFSHYDKTYPKKLEFDTVNPDNTQGETLGETRDLDFKVLKLIFLLKWLARNVDK